MDIKIEPQQQRNTQITITKSSDLAWDWKGNLPSPEVILVMESKRTSGVLDSLVERANMLLNINSLDGPDSPVIDRLAIELEPLGQFELVLLNSWPNFTDDPFMLFVHNISRHQGLGDLVDIAHLATMLHDEICEKANEKGFEWTLTKGVTASVSNKLVLDDVCSRLIKDTGIPAYVAVKAIVPTKHKVIAPEVVVDSKV
jgi:hypothetical protein